MATKTVRQTRFNYGEVDETVFKRTDYKDYLSAAQLLLNCEVGSTGLVKKRKATRKLNNLTQYIEQNSKGYEFRDKNDNYYLIISSNLQFNIFTIVGDSIDFYQTLVSPYNSSDILDLDYDEDNDSLIISGANKHPSRIFVKSYGPVVFEFETLSIFPYPAYDFGLINYDSFTVSLSGNTTTITFQFTGLVSDPGFTTAWIGGQIQGGGDTPEDPLGYAIISNVIPWDGSKVVFTGDVKIPFKISGASTKGSQYVVRQPAWSDSLGWPKTVSSYQNRVWFGDSGSLKDTVFGSQINKPTNFDVGVGDDTDAIIYPIGKTNTGSINWINAGKQLEIYTTNDEFVAPQDVNTALTPSTFSIRQQSSYGSSSKFKPVNYTNDSYFISKTGKSFINFKFDGVGQSYQSTNISIISSHLIKNPINRALLRGTEASQDNFLYILNSDHTITAFQFATNQGLGAFSRIEFEKDEDGNDIIELIDLFTINNEVYLLKYYVLNQIYTIEKFIESDIKLDGIVDSTMDSTGLVTGLDDLEGYTVYVVFDSQGFGSYTVVNGEITVFNPNEFSGPVQVGLIYSWQVNTMYLFSGSSSSSWSKKITSISVDYYNSLELYINNTLVPYQTFEDVQQQLPPVPQTGTATIYPTEGWNRFFSIQMTQQSYADVQILGIDYQIVASIIS